MGEKITPATKNVGKPDGISDGGNSTITTPKKLAMRFWGDRKKDPSIFGKGK